MLEIAKKEAMATSDCPRASKSRRLEAEAQRCPTGSEAATSRRLRRRLCARRESVSVRGAAEAPGAGGAAAMRLVTVPGDAHRTADRGKSVCAQRGAVVPATGTSSRTKFC